MARTSTGGYSYKHRATTMRHTRHTPRMRPFAHARTHRRYRRATLPSWRLLLPVVLALFTAMWLTISLLRAFFGPSPSLVDRSWRHDHSPLEVAGGPSLDAARVDGILTAYGSPLYGHGAQIVALSRQYRVDDAVALAFFVMESRAGTQGEAVLNHSFGNFRPRSGQPAHDGYRAYHTWMESAAEWFSVVRTHYLDQLQLPTVSLMIPVYAPASDHNNPATMIDGIRQLVQCWRGQVAACPTDPPGIASLVAAH